MNPDETGSCTVSPWFLLQILQILVRAVVEQLLDSHGRQAGSVQSKLKELLGRVSSRHSSDPEIWRQYARLYGGGHGDEPEDNEKVGPCLRPFRTKGHAETKSQTFQKFHFLFRGGFVD